MPRLLTDALIGSLRKREGRLEVADSVAPGLRLRRTREGDLVWSLWYRRRNSPGSATRYRLGTYSTDPEKGLTLAAARTEARAWASKIEKSGADPQGDLQATREEERERRRAPKPQTVAGLVAKALPKLSLRPATLKEWTRRLKADILTAPFSSKAAALLKPSEVEEWLIGIAERSGHSANSARTVLLRCYSWAVEKKILPASPIEGVPKPDPEADEKQSERVLAADELRAVLLALDEIEAEGFVSRIAYADAARLLLLTGVRRSSVLGLKRDEVEGLGTPGARWVVPGDRSKNGRPHVVPLSKQAERLIERRLAAVKTAHLFPQYGKDGEAIEKAMTWSSHFVEELKARAARLLGRKMEPWKIHGFRSALATHGREVLKFSGDVVSWLLSHTPPGASITRNYDRSTLLDERRAALIAWARWLDRIKSEEAGGAKVLPMRARA